ncbi:tellurite resistance/C4-dicarboxylate transporter family protein [Janibacter alittae]|uniref:Tellurite resistance/C4-dicarboxylate transporter family protein n=1 Tax=Janibacter alittae TaxID=3115209 RepID=A0ABZ2MJ65_9MICO
MREAITALHPGSFAFVMATGIVSVGMAQQGFVTASRILLGIGVVAWVLLLVALVLRCLLHRDRVVADLHDPVVAFGFFTLIAGTDVLAVRLAEVSWPVSAGLLAFAATVGLFLGYGVPWAAALGRAERPVLQHVNGTWFIWVVASQSVATAAASIEPHVTAGRDEIAALAVSAWSVGVVLYAACAVFVALRILLYPFSPQDLNPPYWVSMGAMAITVVAGAKIVEMDSTPIVEATGGLIGGLAVLGWAWATWLIPVLFAVGVWRHVVHRVPLRYEATWWSIVFPLGMYAVAGMYLGRADSLPIVERIGAAWLWVALLAWVLATVAMVHAWLGGRVARGHSTVGG